MATVDTGKLEVLYRKYNRKKFVHPDPLEFLYGYPDVRDREIAGLVASSLAYGRVAQILTSVDRVLSRMGPSPRDYVENTSDESLTAVFRGFKHRFSTDSHLVGLLSGIRSVVLRYGSLNECFMTGVGKGDVTILPGLELFATSLGRDSNYLIPSPSRGSPCKRLNLFLRWMIRKDAVDPGGWEGVSPSKLIVPLDTHMASIGQAFGFTGKKSHSLAMALEITEAFRALVPEDPVRYDFALTRFGIRSDLEMSDLLRTFCR